MLISRSVAVVVVLKLTCCSSVPLQSHTGPVPPQTLAIYLPSKSPLPWQPASLETVVEETGSELLSPRPPSRLSARLTPRLTSPLLSIDYTPTQVYAHTRACINPCDLQWLHTGSASRDRRRRFSWPAGGRTGSTTADAGPSQGRPAPAPDEPWGGE